MRAAPVGPTVVAIGGLAGAFAGLFGVGGGSVVVPLLLLVLPGLGERRATAASLLAIAVMAASGVLVQGAYGRVHVVAALLIGAPAVLGVLLGTAIQQRLPPRALSLAFGVLLGVVGVVTIVGLHAHAHAGPASLTAAGGVAIVVVGVAAGAIAGLLGVGGGALFVPALTLILGLDQLDAEATSLLAILPVAAVGAINQRRYGNLDLGVGWRLGLGSIPGAAVGVVVANLLAARVAEVLFGALLLVIAARLLAPSRGGPVAVEPAWDSTQ